MLSVIDVVDAVLIVKGLGREQEYVERREAYNPSPYAESRSSSTSSYTR